ncbi:hypothetical protein GUITHDRAFT_120851 [Guillardia theta CCMP2712]|uniref:Uncharacterized protein n=1 Tax=Guillardia theta (strain CCMP2712) TaxID=905079 RepID=L1I9R8_GUITC|nr:hypothetical protein GUITHDRAFT_120851 [Guillardia theta CCMP2712]EKX32973.1 hypothetical protein GUITHDRAFT_120851 [Guillardia theta CCMP2712]|eukprot:XP_005819953.1 hypothetical protein GUITHDRAFT_120851 [Guillardia theta CCMP2712]
MLVSSERRSPPSTKSSRSSGSSNMASCTRAEVLARKRAATYQRLTMQLTLEALLSGARRMTPLRAQSPEEESSPEVSASGQSAASGLLDGFCCLSARLRAWAGDAASGFSLCAVSQEV